MIYRVLLMVNTSNAPPAAVWCYWNCCLYLQTAPPWRSKAKTTHDGLRTASSMMNSEYPAWHKNITNHSNTCQHQRQDANCSGHTWMSLRHMSFCSMVSTRTMSLQRDTTCFSSYSPSPFSSNASSSSSTWESTVTETQWLMWTNRQQQGRVSCTVSLIHDIYGFYEIQERTTKSESFYISVT